MECGYKTFSDFTASQPSPKDLRKIAGKIILKYATPLDKVEKGSTEHPEDDSGGEACIPQAATRRHKPHVPPVVVIPTITDPDKDILHQNAQLLSLSDGVDSRYLRRYCEDVPWRWG